ncbi:P-loop containing nucleoside triphosphate hydrolase protein [Bimuria novae-zelandiae CBS 107.79]|uniref:P-loop containing nucleoside triphosphate hydrolase protein n=1 Tax=Bimuria novae-zelandiae CBS 107.79 TaxID=1447943 RepID=A0A6A5VCD8_9PLEO|nr:P-loop containing nucleoside triphosphate hydrolase protein [Bimuria novae-zelandiae CBS 107.79]
MSFPNPKAAYSFISAGNDKLVSNPIPEIATDADDLLVRTAHKELKMRIICTALEHNCTTDKLRYYLEQRKKSERHHFDDTLKQFGCPALFYAVSRNNIEAVQTLLEYGVDADILNDCFDMPLLAFTILQGKSQSTNTTEVIKQLLAYGASPLVIPKDMWTKYLSDPEATRWRSSIMYDKEAQWCKPEVKVKLAAALHLTHRYLLYRASTLNKPTPRELQLGCDHEIVNLFKVPYFMIGQLPAAKLIMKTVFNHITNHNPSPLVMVFAGPSGHGKTELAEQMGSLLSVKHKKLSCSEIRERMDLLGGSNFYHRSDEGSEFNNFVSDNTGKRAVVVLDEFDTTTEEVRLSLLNTLDKGTFTDRRNNRAVDCSKFIWILATNFGDTMIQSFYDREVKRLSNEKQETVNVTALQLELMEAFKSTYGAPLAGRTRLIVPFLPFSHGEAAVVFHKFFMEYQDRVRAAIDLREGFMRHINHIDLNIYEDGDFSSKVVKKYYDPATGARGVRRAVDVVEANLTEE